MPPTYIADLHIHSHYSRATSKDLDFEHLALWAQLKGVQVVGTGDLSHPGWLQEMREKLEPAEDGLLRLKPDLARAVEAQVPAACRGPVRFLLAGEISNIYKRAAPNAAPIDGEPRSDVRKVHNLVYAPGLETVEAIQIALERIGNIRADGRPILGLDSRDLLEILLEVDARCVLIPAHIWTPWFSMLGSKSGFDRVEDCFADLTAHIFALETGLSSDPPMNWRVSNLDGYTLVSNSDAHSPQKLAREATIFHGEPSYDGLFDALRSGDPAHFGGTLEFFPEEGKYHNDGHRKCGICWEPRETLARAMACPVCGKPLTVGVLHRVEVLADRPAGGRPARTYPFESLIPLAEILGEVHGVGPQSRRVQREYHRLLDRLGPELAILREAPIEDIRRAGGDRLALGIERMRRGHVWVRGGYDGEYGVIKVLDPALAPGTGAGATAVAPPQREPDQEAARVLHDGRSSFALELPEAAQPGLFPEVLPPSPGHAPGRVRRAPSPLLSLEAGATPPMQDGRQSLPLFALDEGVAVGSESSHQDDPWAQLNPQQAAAVQCVDRHLLIVAGPGTGKTHTLTLRMAYLVQARRVDPAAILAITFTNKAAQEMAARLRLRLGGAQARRMTVKTFHALGAQLLREFGAGLPLLPGQDGAPRGEVRLAQDFRIADEGAQAMVLAAALPDLAPAARSRVAGCISRVKNDPAPLAALQAAEPEFAAHFAAYQATLYAYGLVDYDDLIGLCVRLLEESPAARRAVQARYRWISVDEYQDVNAAQVALLKLLVGPQTNLCAIGDPDQAIYGFRGADYRHFFAFEQDFPGAATFTLSRNYRAPQSLLTAAMQVIVKNPRRMAMTLHSPVAQPVQVEVHEAASERAEAETIVQRIEQLLGGSSHFALDSGRSDGFVPGADAPVDLGDFAILVRLHAQTGPLTEALARSGLPYQVVGGPGILDREDARGLAAGLQWLHNPASTPASSVAVTRLCAWDLSLADQARVQAALVHVAAGAPGHNLTVSWWIEAAATELPRSHRAKLGARAALLDGARPQLEDYLARFAEPHTGQAPAVPAMGIAGALDRLRAFFDAHPPHFPACDPATPARLLAMGRANEQGWDAFLEDLVLARAADAYDPRVGRIALMTLHAAKGLEFPVVFIAGCEEGLLPYAPPTGETETGSRDSHGHEEAGMERAEERRAGIEEERRLFYVGLTRARARLILTHARRRLLFGRTEARALSRFVDDIEATLKALQAASYRPAPAKPQDHQLRLF